MLEYRPWQLLPPDPPPVGPVSMTHTPFLFVHTPHDLDALARELSRATEIAVSWDRREGGMEGGREEGGVGRQID